MKDETLTEKILVSAAFSAVCGLAVLVIPNIHHIWRYFHA